MKKIELFYKNMGWGPHPYLNRSRTEILDLIEMNRDLGTFIEQMRFVLIDIL
jgi:hypothetical protein